MYTKHQCSQRTAADISRLKPLLLCFNRPHRKHIYIEIHTVIVHHEGKHQDKVYDIIYVQYCESKISKEINLRNIKSQNMYSALVCTPLEKIYIYTCIIYYIV